jgi:hypothetical protein
VCTDLLQRLLPVRAAFHDAHDASPSCLEGTRERLLTDIFTWFDNMDDSSSHVFWLNGLAGTGKTTVARSVAARAREQERLAGTFFFSRNNADTRKAHAVIPTILYQLAIRHHMFRQLICTAIKSDIDVRDRAIATQVKTLLANLGSTTTTARPLLIVIDALDECDPGNNDDGVGVIRALIDTVASLPSFKLFITSRVERNISDMFRSEYFGARKLALHYDIETRIVRSDIHLYLERKFSELGRKRNIDLPFPSVEDLEKLIERAGTLFIYAATVFKYVADQKSSPKLRLKQILSQTPSQVPYQYRTLDMVYSQVISDAAVTTEEPDIHTHTLHSILSTLVVLQESLPLAAIAELTDIGKEETEVIVQRLSSVLLVEQEKPIRLYHPSFPDFITDPKRCRNDIGRYVVTPSEVHTYLARRCLEVMNTYLRRDMCNIRDAALLNSEIPNLHDELAEATPRELRYACKFWCIHLRLSKSGKLPDKTLDGLIIFTTKHLFHWVEMLSLMGELSVVQHDLLPLLTYLNVCVALAYLKILLMNN